MCLIFTPVETDNPFKTVLSIMQNYLKMKITQSQIAACHPLHQGNTHGPVILKFVYHDHRDMAWERRSWLKRFVNTKKQKIFLEECLAPTDRIVKKKAAEKGFQTVTRKQKVYAFKANHPDSKPVRIASVKDLEKMGAPSSQSFLSNPLSSYSMEVITDPTAQQFAPQTPLLTPLPPLQRKPPTPRLTQATNNRNKTQKRSVADILSPIAEGESGSEFC